MAFRLPPLSPLRVFEAAARLASFRKAADELNLTASAVSHAIQTLENWLGVELFIREARGLRLTGAGEAYAPLVTQALGLLAQATEHLPGRAPTGTLSISSAPTFAAKMLLPRLDRFAAQFPDIRLTIDTSHRLVDLALDDFDLAIRYASTEKPAADWTLLVAETLVPACSPALRQRFAALSLAELLQRATLIHVTSTSTDWSHWLRANAMEIPPDGGLRVDTMQMGFDAAMRGLGVVLGRHPLIDEESASGRLVPLAREPTPSGNGYWLVTAAAEFQKTEVKSFRRWLLSELGVAAPRKPRP
ncbi:MAG TPA: LysR substrate-binding domain-containing protein [Xanthobacteraceae bacterium]|nr:LysR substrate-binding domain-containing protein [Xanthobacteraceae bacterium]